MFFDSGKLRHRVLIEEYDYLRDSSGEVIQDPETGETSRAWTQVAMVWAAIEPLSVKELISAQAVQSQITARITIRYRAGLDAAMRFVHMVKGVRGAIYNPAGMLADRDSGLEYITVPCSAGVSDSGQ